MVRNLEGESTGAGGEALLRDLANTLGVALTSRRRDLLKREVAQDLPGGELDLLTNGQTYFYRHSVQCSAFVELLKRRAPEAPLRIWSAGCSTGCEVYTIALLLLQAARTGSILGTDIHPIRLRAAAEGLYSKSRLLRVPEQELSRYFIGESSGKWRVGSRLRVGVEFRLENLGSSEAPSFKETWDVIFCRNVLIYFQEARARELLHNLVESLAVGGLLILGFPEAFYGLQQPQLGMVINRAAIFEKLPKEVELPDLEPTSVSEPAENHFLRAMRYHAKGRLAEARHHFRMTEEESPDFFLVHYFLARLADEDNRPEQARERLQKFFADYSPGSEQALNFLKRHQISPDQVWEAALRLQRRLGH